MCNGRSSPINLGGTPSPPLRPVAVPPTGQLQEFFKKGQWPTEEFRGTDVPPVVSRGKVSGDKVLQMLRQNGTLLYNF